MRKRTIRVQLMLTEKEYVRLTTNAAKCGFSMSGYLRELLNAHTPKELPPLEYYRLLNQLYRITEMLRTCYMPSDSDQTNISDVIIELRELIKEMRKALC